MRQNLYAVEPAPPLPGMPFQGLVFMRILEAGEVCNLQRLQDGGWGVEWQLERRPDQAQGGLHHGPGPRPPKGCRKRLARADGHSRERCCRMGATHP